MTHAKTGMAPLLLLALVVSPSIGAVPLRTVALSGQQAPGTPDGVVFTNFNRPQMNALGEVSFTSGLEGPGVGVRSRQGLWSERTGDINLIVRLGGPAVGTSGGGIHSSLSNHEISDVGSNAFSGTLIGRGSERAIFSNASGELRLIARENDTAPNEAADFTYRDIRDHRSNSLGKLAFTGAVSDTLIRADDIQKIWLVDEGLPQTIAQGGDLAPGAGNDLRFAYFSRPTLNSSGQLAFIANLSDFSPSDPQRPSIWSNAPGSLTLVARTGQSGPGVPVGESFGSFDFVGPTINAAGQVAFRGILFDDLTNRESGDGIWLHQPESNELQLIARSGLPAAGIDGVVYGEASFPLLSSNGAVTFTTQLAGVGVDTTNDAALWSGTSENLARIARLGEQAPGTSDGVVFSEFTRFVAANASGQVAFVANVSGTGIDSSNDRGIWAQNRQGVLQAILLEGTTLEVSPGVFKTVESVVMTSNRGDDTGYGGSFNDLGQIAFWASFTDDTQGLFVTNVVAVPEPGAFALFALEGIFCIACRKRSSERQGLPRF